MVCDKKGEEFLVMGGLVGPDGMRLECTGNLVMRDGG
jgi:hypothetical protein